MKYIIVLVVLSLLSFASCDLSEVADDKEVLFRQISEDPIFIDYSDMVGLQASKAAMDEYDLKAIGRTMDLFPATTSACELPKDAFKEIKGGLLYLETSCRLGKSRRLMKEKYPEYFQLSSDDRTKIRRLRDIYTGRSPFDAAREAAYNRISLNEN